MKIATKLTWAGLLLFIPALLSAVTAPRWSVFETARDNGHRLSPVAEPAYAPADSAALTLRPAERYQEMVGFGGALTESSAWVLAQLSPENREAVIRRYYDPQEGIGYTLARTHLNSCDFSLSMWSLDETPGDYDLHDFSLAPMRKWVLPLLQDTYRIAGTDNFRLLVSPWSPPFWMKTNFRMDDGGALRGSYQAPWANFYVKFLQAMQAEHLPVWGFTVQNEPEAHQTWDSCLYSPEEERDFVRDHLGPALENAGFSSVKLIGWDHNRDRIEARAAALFDDPAFAKYFWGLGVHWYVSDDFDASARVHAAYPDKHVLFTEGCFEGGSGLGSWSHGEGYAHQMIGDFKHWVCGFIDWNIVLDQRGGPNHVGNFCDAPVLVDTNTKAVSYHASFYYIAHFSKFVRPGAHRVGSTGGPEGLESIAFANPDGSLVTVVVNASDLAVPFQLAVDGESLACTIPAHGIQTYIRAR